MCGFLSFRNPTHQNAPQNMYHLLDKDQLDLDGFDAFGPGDSSTSGAGADATAAATAAAPSVAAAAKPKAKAKAKNGGAGAAAADRKQGKGKGNVTARITGMRRGKAEAPTEGMDKEEMRRLGLYAAFLLPLADSMCPNRKRANVSVSTQQQYRYDLHRGDAELNAFLADGACPTHRRHSCKGERI